MSRTDASAAHLNVTLLLASTEQFRRVLAPALTGAPRSPPHALLDIGAGRGDVTAALAAALGAAPHRVTVLEASAPLRRRLAAAGYRARASLDELAGERFGAVALMNVLDRCDDPHGLLAAALGALRPRGLLLVATNFIARCSAPCACPSARACSALTKAFMPSLSSRRRVRLARRASATVTSSSTESNVVTCGHEYGSEKRSHASLASTLHASFGS